MDLNYQRSRGSGSLAHRGIVVLKPVVSEAADGHPLWVPHMCRRRQFVALAVAEGRRATSITSPGCTSKSSDMAILSHFSPVFRLMVTSARRSFVPIGKARSRDGLQFLAQSLHFHPQVSQANVRLLQSRSRLIVRRFAVRSICLTKSSR